MPSSFNRTINSSRTHGNKKSTDGRVSNWIDTLSAVQLILLVWLLAVVTSVVVGVALADNSLANAVTVAVGAATGAAIVVYLLGFVR